MNSNAGWAIHRLLKNSKALGLRGSDKVHLARRHDGIMQKRILFSV